MLTGGTGQCSIDEFAHNQTSDLEYLEYWMHRSKTTLLRIFVYSAQTFHINRIKNLQKLIVICNFVNYKEKDKI